MLRLHLEKWLSKTPVFRQLFPWLRQSVMRPDGMHEALHAEKIKFIISCLRPFTHAWITKTLDAKVTHQKIKLKLRARFFASGVNWNDNIQVGFGDLMVSGERNLKLDFSKRPLCHPAQLLPKTHMALPASARSPKQPLDLTRFMHSQY